MKIVKILLLLLIFSGISCKKENDPDEANQPVIIPDYRLKYIGDFEFTSYRWSSSMGITSYSDTVIYTGTVELPVGSDSTIKITYRPGEQTFICGFDSIFGAHIEPKILTTGEMAYDFMGCNNQNSFIGNYFTIDSLRISLGTGGLGMQIGHGISGVRL